MRSRVVCNTTKEEFAVLADGLRRTRVPTAVTLQALPWSHLRVLCLGARTSREMSWSVNAFFVNTAHVSVPAFLPWKQAG